MDLRHIINSLSSTKRRIWLSRGIPPADCESVADHCHALACYCLALGLKDIQSEAVAIANVHALSEVITGDIIPSDDIPSKTKTDREQLAHHFFRVVDPDAGTEFERLWTEYQQDKTPAARFVRDVQSLQEVDKAYSYAAKYSSLKDDLADLVLKGKMSGIRDPGLKAKAQETLRKWLDLESRPETFIFVIGGPGVGKGTQCQRAATQLGACHISAGELLRDEQGRPESPWSDFITASFKASIPVPPTLMMQLLKDSLAEQQRRVVLLDGFPRSMSQLEAFETQLSSSYGTIHLVANDGTLRERLSKRAKSSGRMDDSPALIKKRLESMTMPGDLLERLREQTFIFIDSAQSVEDVESEFLKAITEIAGNDTVSTG